VLRCLLERPGQLVTHAELLQAVWSDVYVNEALPRMCIRELRRALGDNAQRPQFIATAPRRGYRFLATGTTGPPGVSRSHMAMLPLSPPYNLPTAPPFFVGRQAELRQLHAWFARAAGGDRQIVFVTGEAGIGKTTLIEALLTQCTPYGDLAVSYGQ